MIVCHCNTIAHEAFEATLALLFDDVSQRRTLNQAVGIVWRKTIDEKRTHRNPFSCTICFEEVAKMIQSKGLFEGEKLPVYRSNCSNCPRLSECGLSLTRGCE